jgi:hypothetical protein
LASEPLSAAFVRERYEKATKAVRTEQHEYWLNFAFLQGQQWLWYNPETRRLDILPRDPQRVQVTINRLLPASRIIIAKAVSREMHFEVIPNGADDATARGARLAESVLTDVVREHDWESLREKALWAVWKGGTAVICVEWDPTAGIPLSVETESGMPVATGDTKETVLTIAEAVFEPGVTEPETARWWIKAQVRPPEEVRATYRLPEPPPADATAGMNPFQQKLVWAHSGMGLHEPTSDLTLVLTYYERPNNDRPEGAVVVVVGDKVVQRGPWPYPWKDRLNCAVMRDIRVETRWTGDSTLSAARPVQVAFNASWSSIIEHMKLTGNARLAVPQSAVDLIESFTDTPGEIVPYPDGTAQPAWITPPQMPAWWIEQPTRLAAQIDDILGVHDVSRGTTPPNVESGYGLSLLIEQDTTPVTRLVKETSIAWSKIASMVLKLYEANVTEPRRSVIRVPGQQPESVHWSGKDFMGQTTAILPVEQIVPRSRAAMQAFADRALQMGLIKTVDQYARLIEMPQQYRIIDAVEPDVARARRENHWLAQGEPCAPEAFDDHAVHIREHNDFRKSARYHLLPDEIKQLFELHIKGHETLAAEEMGRQVAKGAISPALAATPSAEQAPTIPTEEVANVGRAVVAGAGAGAGGPGSAGAGVGGPAPG